MLPPVCYITLGVSVFLLSCGAYADCDGDACSAERAKEIEEEDAAGSNILLLQTALRFEDDGQASEKSNAEIIEEAGNTEIVSWCAMGYQIEDGYHWSWGDDGVRFGVRGNATVNDCEECAQLCNNEKDCGAYECSPTELKCNLHWERLPHYALTTTDYGHLVRFCMKACATGYKKVTGDIKGWGEIGSLIPYIVWGGGTSVSDCNECAQTCTWGATGCVSYECSHTKLQCSVNTIRRPTLPDNYKDFDFCMKEICASGYEEEVGDVAGWGSIDGKGGGEIVASCQQCAGFCDSYPACLSYECSLEELKCNLNELREPSCPGCQFRTYGFCKKNKIS